MYEDMSKAAHDYALSQWRNLTLPPLVTEWLKGLSVSKETIKESAAPFFASVVKCPCCGYSNFMGRDHKIGDKVNCSNCFEWFMIGGK